jgi:putative ABC transport system permease protein
MLKRFFILAVRNLVKYKQTTLISIIGLVIALSVALQIIQWCTFELSYDQYNSKADRIYRFTVEESRPEDNFYWHFARCWQPWRTKLPDFYPEIESLVELRPMWKTTVKTKNNAFYTNKSFAVDSTIFRVFDFNFVEGNSNTAINAQNTVVLSESLAKKLFPNQDAMGKVFELYGGNTNGFEKHTITGIYKDMPANSHFHADMLVHNNPKPVEGNDFAFTYILMKKGHNIGEITSRIDEFKKTHVPEGQQKSSTIHFTPITDIHLKSHIEREIEPNGDIKQVRLFILVGLGVLLIAMINYINLLLASLEKRGKYLYLNIAIGAQQKHNVMLLLIESLCIAIIVFVISAILFKPLLLLLGSSGIISTMPLQLNSISVLVALSIFILIALSGILPVFTAKLNTSRYFTSNTSRLLNGKSAIINKPLLVLQFIFSIIIIISSLMLSKQNSFLFSRNLGYGNNNIVIIPRNNDAEESRIMMLKEELLKIPVVEDVSMSMNPPGYLVKDARSIEYANIPEVNKKQIITILPVDGNFFSFFHIPLVAGSEKAYIPGQKVENYILNEAAIKKLGFESSEKAIGTPFKIINFGNQDIIKGGTIVGVVRDFNFSSLYNPIEPTIFFQNPIWQGQYLVKLAPGDRDKGLALIGQVWNKVFADSPFDYQFLDDAYNEQYHRDIVSNKLVGWFSVICVIISSIGLWGISSILVVRKTKEIGIRKVNGAYISEMLVMLNKDFVKWVVIAFVIATPIAYYAMHKWLENFAYKTTLSWWIFALAGLLALGIAMLTVSWQSWKAATRNPVEALRYE